MNSHKFTSLATKRVAIHQATQVVRDILRKCGCSPGTSEFVTAHLIDTSLSGIESHGVTRVLQYAEQLQEASIIPQAEPELRVTEAGIEYVDGDQGIGIPVMQMAYERGIELADKNRIAVIGVRNAGHTGRHGAFADFAAQKGCFTLCFGGGNRKKWRQVAPYNGRQAILPTNPWCIGMPGDRDGSVFVDFATSAIAGGWIYAAQAQLAENWIIGRDGHPTSNPQDYFDGGAIQPAAGAKGYGLALIGELVAEAMLGPADFDCNWLIIAMAVENFRAYEGFAVAAEEILGELRDCPPLPGKDKVKIPGQFEREMNMLGRKLGLVTLPASIWEQIEQLHARLDCDSN